MIKSIIAAVADNGAIGRDNELLWHLSEDLRYFRRVTLGSAVVMGRNTFLSLGKPLPGRFNIVVTRDPDARFDGAAAAASPEDACSAAQAAAAAGECRADECFIIGGGALYRSCMDTADRLYITEVHVSPKDADTFFPEINPASWKETSRSEKYTDPGTGCTFEFVVYERK